MLRVGPRAEVGSDGTPDLNQPRVFMMTSGSPSATARSIDLAAALVFRLRIYWNTHPTMTIATVNSDVLAPDLARAYISKDAGVTWVSIAADYSLPFTPTSFILYTKITSGGSETIVEFELVSLSLSSGATRGVTVDFVGVEVASGEGLARLGSRRKS